MCEIVTKKYGKSLWTFRDENKEYIVACFLKNQKIVIRKRSFTSEKGTLQIGKKGIIYTLNNFIATFSGVKDLTSTFKALKKYEHIDSKLEIQKKFIEEVGSFHEKMNFSKDGFRLHYLILKYMISYKLILDIELKYTFNKLYLAFLKNIEAIPKLSEKTGTFRETVKDNKKYKPNQLVEEIIISDKYILYIHQGGFSTYDMLLKYRVYDGDAWSRIRTPKHIHWAVDLLLKKQEKKNLTIKFVDKLIEQWDGRIQPLTNNKEREEIIIQSFKEFPLCEFSELDSSGEYPTSFLWIIAILLMYQEKTNYNKAYMFRKLLLSLKMEEGNYKIISTATHR